MKMLETKQEIAIAINMHEMPVVRIDLADADEYGIKSQKVLIDNGKFRRLNPTDPDMPYLVLAIVDSRRKVAYKPIILHTRNRVDPNCQVPLGFTDEDNDATEYIRAAGCREWK